MTRQELKAKLQDLRTGCKRLPDTTRDERFYQLMCKVLDEAIVDYVGETPIGTKSTMPGYFFDQNIILRDLTGQRLTAYSDGMSKTVAMHLVNNFDQIKKNIQTRSKEYTIVRVIPDEKPEYR